MRTVIVTGARGGIGEATARKFLELGDRVYGTDLAFDETPPDFIEVICDVTDPDAVSGLVERAASETGRIDVLVNNAGIRVEADVINTTIEEWDRMMAVNLTAVFLGCKFALPHMLKQASGAIVNVASVAGLNPLAEPRRLLRQQSRCDRAYQANGAAIRPPRRSGECGLSGCHDDALFPRRNSKNWRPGSGGGCFLGALADRAVWLEPEEQLPTRSPILPPTRHRLSPGRYSMSMAVTTWSPHMWRQGVIER